jgi:hypothetical protein
VARARLEMHSQKLAPHSERVFAKRMNEGRRLAHDRTGKTLLL